MVASILLWSGYFFLIAYLVWRGNSHDTALGGTVGFGIQAFAYVATYISAVALVGFGGLAYRYGLQMMLIAAGNAVLGTWVVYRFLAWPTRQCQKNLGARTPAQLIALGHNAPWLGKSLALIFAVFLGVYASAVLKGAALLLSEIVPLSASLLIWIVAILVGIAVYVGGLRGVLYTEALQGVIMLAGMSLLIYSVIQRVGGPIDGILALSQLPPTEFANNGFTSLSSGGEGLFILSLTAVTSVAVWAQPQMIQRHFAIFSQSELKRSTPLAVIALTVLVGGTYFIASLSRLILPQNLSPDEVLPTLVSRLLPDFALQLFVLAIVSASLSTATALFHIAATSISEDLCGLSGRQQPQSLKKQKNSISWASGIILCVIVSAGCAQIEGQFVALLCATSWSIIGAAVLVPYIALVRFGKSNTRAAWASSASGFLICLGWYLFVSQSTAVITPIFGPTLAAIPPFFAGFAASLFGWFIMVRKKNPVDI